VELKYNDTTIMTVECTHGIGAGYSGKYSSAPYQSSMWQFDYTLNAYLQLNEKFTIKVMDFYQMDIEFNFQILNINLKQIFKFVHPIAIIRGQTMTPKKDFIFDFKI